jgi:hypothetical protein
MAVPEVLEETKRRMLAQITCRPYDIDDSVIYFPNLTVVSPSPLLSRDSYGGKYVSFLHLLYVLLKDVLYVIPECPSFIETFKRPGSFAHLLPILLREEVLTSQHSRLDILASELITEILVHADFGTLAALRLTCFNLKCQVDSLAIYTRVTTQAATVLKALQVSSLIQCH